MPAECRRAHVEDPCGHGPLVRAEPFWDTVLAPGGEAKRLRRCRGGARKPPNPSQSPVADAVSICATDHHKIEMATPLRRLIQSMNRPDTGCMMMYVKRKAETMRE